MSLAPVEPDRRSNDEVERLNDPASLASEPSHERPPLRSLFCVAAVFIVLASSDTISGHTVAVASKSYFTVFIAPSPLVSTPAGHTLNLNNSWDAASTHRMSVPPVGSCAPGGMLAVVYVNVPLMTTT